MDGLSVTDRLETLRKERDAYARALAESNQAFQEKVKEFSIIKRIGDSMRWNLDKRQICEEIVDIIIDETTAENCSLWLVDPAREHIHLTAARGQKDMQTRYFETGSNATKIPLGEGVAGWVAQNGTSLLIQDVSKSETFLEFGLKMPSSIKSMLCLPIKGADSVTGVVNMSHPDIGMFSKDNERVLSLITNQAALAFANLHMFESIQSFSEQLELKVVERTRELSYSESKFRSFMENAGDAIFVVNKNDGRIIEANGRACEYTGFARNELLDTDLGRIFDQEVRTKLNDTLESGSGRLEAAPMRTRSGEIIFTGITANVITTPTGEVAHMIVRDITKRLQMESQLKEYNERLEELVKKRTLELEMAQDELVQAGKMAAIGELASGVAHEINNPVAVISGYAEDLTDRVKLYGLQRLKEDEIMSALTMITIQAERCLNITGSLLNFSRKRELFLTPVDINHAIKQSLSFANHKVGDRNIKFINRLSGDLPLVHTDMNMLEQILLNLYSNAIDAIGKKGSIITTTCIGGDTILISISDDGQGISPENMTKIFDPFFTTKSVGKGTGLGLSICQQLVERLRGRIVVESFPGQGASFTISLPAGGDPARDLGVS